VRVDVAGGRVLPERGRAAAAPAVRRGGAVAGGGIVEVCADEAEVLEADDLADELLLGLLVVVVKEGLG